MFLIDYCIFSDLSFLQTQLRYQPLALLRIPCVPEQPPAQWQSPWGLFFPPSWLSLICYQSPHPCVGSPTVGAGRDSPSVGPSLSDLPV